MSKIDLSNVRALLFDIDGTLLDSLEFIFSAFEHALAAEGQPPASRSQMAVALGPPLRECYELLVPGADLDRLARRHREFQINNLDLITPFASAQATLAALHARGYALAAVTTRSSVTSIKTLERADLLQYFGCVRSAEDTKNLKPHPEPLLSALQELGFRADQAMMIGDTRSDVDAGKNAGTLTVGVTYGFAGQDLASENPDYLIDDLGELLTILPHTIEDGPK